MHVLLNIKIPLIPHANFGQIPNRFGKNVDFIGFAISSNGGHVGFYHSEALQFDHAAWVQCFKKISHLNGLRGRKLRTDRRTENRTFISHLTKAGAAKFVVTGNSCRKPNSYH